MTNVLLVEDDEDMRLMIRMTLQTDPDLSVSGEAADAAGAIAAARSSSPAVIILDHTIEGPITGLEAASELRRAAPGAKILLFSAHDMAKEAAAEPAIDGFLRKDGVRQLIATIKTLLDQP